MAIGLCLVISFESLALIKVFDKRLSIEKAVFKGQKGLILTFLLNYCIIWPINRWFFDNFLRSAA